jgi:hypothetical protein
MHVAIMSPARVPSIRAFFLENPPAMTGAEIGVTVLANREPALSSVVVIAAARPFRAERAVSESAAVNFAKSTLVSGRVLIVRWSWT